MVVNKQNKQDKIFKKLIEDNHNTVKSELIQLNKKSDEISFN